MQTIYKYPIEIHDEFTIEMPMRAKILDVQVQNGIACIWALVNPDAPKIDRKFHLYGIGHKHNGSGEYIGTFQFNNNLVFHLFN